MTTSTKIIVMPQEKVTKVTKCILLTIHLVTYHISHLYIPHNPHSVRLVVVKLFLIVHMTLKLYLYNAGVQYAMYTTRI